MGMDGGGVAGDVPFCRAGVGVVQLGRFCDGGGGIGAIGGDVIRPSPPAPLPMLWARGDGDQYGIDCPVVGMVEPISKIVRVSNIW